MGTILEIVNKVTLRVQASNENKTLLEIIQEELEKEKGCNHVEQNNGNNHKKNSI